jgi:hypothetical protein
VSEAYWLGGVEFDGNADADLAGMLQRTLARAHVRSQWLDAACWLDRETAEAGAPVLAPDLPWLGYPPAPLLAHLALHDAARCLELNETSLMLVVCGSGSAAAAAVLASPQAVGKWNLLPDALLAERLLFTVPDGQAVQPPLARALERHNRSLEEIACLANVTAEADEPTLTGLPDGIQTLCEANLIAALNRLARKLSEQQAEAGLLFSRRPGQPCLATLVERV